MNLHLAIACQLFNSEMTSAINYIFVISSLGLAKYTSMKLDLIMRIASHPIIGVFKRVSLLCKIIGSNLERRFNSKQNWKRSFFLK